MSLQNFQVCVINLSGKTLMIDVTRETTISQLKAKILDRVGVSFNDVYLIHQSKPLSNDEFTIQDYNIQANTQIFMIARLKGGN
jgi:hypothetical protein